MSCSKCYGVLRYESNLHVRCGGCGDRFHVPCLTSDEMSAFSKAMRERKHWHCRECADESDSIREELKNLWRRVPPTPIHHDPMYQMQNEAAQALEVLDNLMRVVDEHDGVVIGPRRNKRARLEEKEEKKPDEKQDGGQDGEQPMEPGNAEGFADM